MIHDSLNLSFFPTFSYQLNISELLPFTYFEKFDISLYFQKFRAHSFIFSNYI